MGKLLGRGVLAGDASGVGDDQLLLRGRAATPVSSLCRVCARNTGKLRRVSAVVMVKQGQAREERGEAGHDLAVLDLNLGSGGNSRMLEAAGAFEKTSPPS